MAYPKHFRFNYSKQELSHFGFVLAHPARLSIIELLSAHRVLRRYEIVEKLPLSPTAISDHLRYLERAQLIKLADNCHGDTGYKLDVSKYREYLRQLNQWLDEVAILPAA